jgi:phosphomannomutase
LIIRPSGTEPKVKFYYTAVGADMEEAKKLLEKMMQQISG